MMHSVWANTMHRTLALRLYCNMFIFVDPYWEGQWHVGGGECIESVWSLWWSDWHQGDYPRAEDQDQELYVTARWHQG